MICDLYLMEILYVIALLLVSPSALCATLSSHQIRGFTLVFSAYAQGIRFIENFGLLGEILDGNIYFADKFSNLLQITHFLDRKWAHLVNNKKKNKKIKR